MSAVNSPRLVLRIMWSALLFSSVALLLVSVFVPVAPADSQGDASLAYALFAFALCGLAASFIVPRVLAGPVLARVPPTLLEEPDPDSAVGFRGAVPLRRTLVEPRGLRDQIERASHAATIVGFALAESVSMGGVALSFIEGPSVHSVLLWSLGFARLLSLVPRWSWWARRYASHWKLDIAASHALESA
jgi:hypothetical protein